jgi:hypothetical protein
LKRSCAASDEQNPTRPLARLTRQAPLSRYGISKRTASHRDYRDPNDAGLSSWLGRDLVFANSGYHEEARIVADAIARSEGALRHESARVTVFSWLRLELAKPVVIGMFNLESRDEPICLLLSHQWDRDLKVAFIGRSAALGFEQQDDLGREERNARTCHVNGGSKGSTDRGVTSIGSVRRSVFGLW